ncbi:MAG: hypothetical protein JXR48_12970 [Candidatus Delongbacteria bacterium]|nr:hypothetical protein [Candidatus Delongbacteria bacterium]MBN2835865.1 hypothetical protein [Candidatus Delongbacteria bacterium]
MVTFISIILYALFYAVKGIVLKGPKSEGKLPLEIITYISGGLIVLLNTFPVSLVGWIFYIITIMGLYDYYMRTRKNGEFTFPGFSYLIIDSDDVSISYRFPRLIIWLTIGLVLYITSGSFLKYDETIEIDVQSRDNAKIKIKL